MPLVPTISPIAEDWVKKGFHVKIGYVELKMCPTIDNDIVFKAYFSSTPYSDVDPAIRIATHYMKNKTWLAKLRETAIRAREYYGGLTGDAFEEWANGRRYEMRRLEKILDHKLEDR